MLHKMSGIQDLYEKFLKELSGNGINFDNDVWNTLCRANVSATSMRAPCGSAHRSPPLIFLWYQYIYKHFGGKSMTGKEERIKTDDSYRSDEHKN